MLPGNLEGRHTRGETRRKRYQTNQARRLRIRNQKSKLGQQLKEISSLETSSTGSGSLNHINVNTMLHDGLLFFHLSGFLTQLNYCSLTSYHEPAELHFHTHKQSSHYPEDNLHQLTPPSLYSRLIRFLYSCYRPEGSIWKAATVDLILGYLLSCSNLSSHT